MSTVQFLVRHKGVHASKVPDRYLGEPGGHLGCSFRKAHRFDTFEEAKKEADRYESWREVVRLTFKTERRVKDVRVPVLKAVR